MAAYLHWLKLQNQYVNVMFVVASDEDWNGGEEDAYAMLWRVEKHSVMNTGCKREGGLIGVSRLSPNKDDLETFCILIQCICID